MPLEPEMPSCWASCLSSGSSMEAKLLPRSAARDVVVSVMVSFGLLDSRTGV